MKISYIVSLGIYNENTTEETILKEIEVKATDVFEAHKFALNKCNIRKGEDVFEIRDSKTKECLFMYKQGFKH